MIDTISETRARRLGGYLKQPLLAATTVALLDTLVMLIWLGSVSRSGLVLILFLEGGLGLIAGVIIALSSSPSISKVGELTIGTAAWSRESEKHAEKIGSKWMLASSIIIALGFILSAI